MEVPKKVKNVVTQGSILDLAEFLYARRLKGG